MQTPRCAATHHDCKKTPWIIGPTEKRTRALALMATSFQCCGEAEVQHSLRIRLLGLVACKQVTAHQKAVQLARGLGMTELDYVLDFSVADCHNSMSSRTAWAL